MYTHQVFNYKTPFLLNAIEDGPHKSRRQGSDGEFYRKSNFFTDPVPGRLDLLQSVTDPFENLFVRSFRQQNKLQVLTLTDGSSSMSIENKPDIVSACMFSIQQSVMAMNDAHYRYLLTDKTRALPETITLNDERQQLLNFTDSENDAAGFLQLASLLPARPSLIFLISDFHWNDHKISHVLQSLNQHIVVPVVIWMHKEYQGYPLWRFINVRDAETGKSQLLFVTPKQRQLIEASFEQRKQSLNKLFNQHHRRPIWFFDHYSVQTMRRYFNA